MPGLERAFRGRRRSRRRLERAVLVGALGLGLLLVSSAVQGRQETAGERSGVCAGRPAGPAPAPGGGPLPGLLVVLAVCAAVAAEALSGTPGHSLRHDSAAMVLLDQQTGQILEANPAALAFYGFSREELLAMTAEKLSALPPEQARAILLGIAVQQGGRWESRHKRADGSVCDVEVAGSVLDLGGRRVVHLIVHDISRRRRAEEEVQRNEARLRSLVDILQHPAETTQEFLDYALDQAVALTGSCHGLICFHDEGTGELTLNTWSREVMAACAATDLETHYQVSAAGLWAEAVRQRRPVVINDFSTLRPGGPIARRGMCRSETTCLCRCSARGGS